MTEWELNLGLRIWINDRKGSFEVICFIGSVLGSGAEQSLTSATVTGSGG